MKYMSIKIYPWDRAPIEFKNLLTVSDPTKTWVILIPKDITDIPFTWGGLDCEIFYFDDYDIFIMFPETRG